jgi:hypothetical protein
MTCLDSPPPLAKEGGELMAEWISVRANIDRDPHTIAMADRLAGNPELAVRLGLPPGIVITRQMTRHLVVPVVVAALVRVWATANETGAVDGDDLVMDHCSLDALDDIADVPGFGAAMAAVGWAEARQDGAGVSQAILPKFKRHNVPAVDRKKQQGAANSKRYRDRNREREHAEAERLERERRGASDDASSDAAMTRHRNRQPTEQDRTVGRLDLPTTLFTPETAEPSSGVATPARPDDAQKPLLEPIALLTFPCDGQRKSWGLSRDQIANWSSLYPKLDVLAECRKALAWVESDPSRRKTHRGMTRFLVDWLNRATNMPARVAAAPRVAESMLDKIDRAFAEEGGAP